MEKASTTFVQVEEPIVENITTTKRVVQENFVVDEEGKNESMPKNRANERKLPKIDNRKLYSQKDKEIVENIKIEETPSNKSELLSIAQNLRVHFVFYSLSDTELENISNKMFYCSLKKNDTIFQQGDDATCFFVLAKGKLEVIINEQPRKQLGPGDGFGELALLYHAPRSATIKALEDSFLYGIDRNTFKTAVQEMMTAQYAENRKFIDEIKFFDAMTSEQKDAIAGAMISCRYNKDDHILNEGDLASSFYILQEGTVVVIKDGKEIRQMTKGDSFGEQALYYNSVRSATVKALTNCRCITLGRDTLTEALGSHIQVITLRNQQKWAFEKSLSLSELTKIQMEKIADRMKIENFKKGDVLYHKGDSLSSKIVILHQGSLSSGGSPFVSKNGIIGDEGLIDDKKAEEKAVEDIISEGDAVVSVIKLEDFTTSIGGPFKEIRVKNQKSHEKKMGAVIVADLKLKADTITLEDLIYYRKLGEGQFGSVYLVKHPSLDSFMALKCVSKKKIIETQLEKHIKQEQLVMESINFPFIVNLIKTFSDDHNIYFLQEYVKGLELFDVIRDMNLLNKLQTQFFIGQLFLCLEYLHSNKIIYRDLKPENIMIDHMGYVKLIDMGTAKFLPSKTHKTFTTIGTPHYMAPEVILGKGYGLLADLWSVGNIATRYLKRIFYALQGICLFEFMCGALPFGEEAEDPQEVCEEILSKPLKIPAWLKDPQTRKMIAQLINKLPDIRLGSSYAALKANAWFEGFDWDRLMEKEIPAPYIPPSKKLISEGEIQKMTTLGHRVVDEIKKEQKK